MEIKLFEVRDEGTLIPAMATRVLPGGPTAEAHERERALLSRAGFGVDGGMDNDYVIFQHLHKGPSTYNVFDWDGSRTMHVAHSYIRDNWRTLKTGDLIDVQFILGETSEKKTSEL